MKTNSTKANETANEITTATATVNENTNSPKTGTQLKRDELRELSRQVMPMVKEGTYKNVNMALIESLYKRDGNEIFKTYDQWRADGFQVRKGEKAFLIWSRPNRKQEEGTEEQKFFRLAFLFSNLQVEAVMNSEPEIVQEPPIRYGLAEIEVSYKPTKIEMAPDAIRNSREVADVLRSFFDSFMEYREAFYILYLNRANKPIGVFQLSIGGQTGTVADVKMGLQVALTSHACGMILCHNHPSGNTQPSDADLGLTKKFKNAAALFDVQVLDHIILTQNSYFSFADEGRM